MGGIATLRGPLSWRRSQRGRTRREVPRQQLPALPCVQEHRGVGLVYRSRYLTSRVILASILCMSAENVLPAEPSHLQCTGILASKGTTWRLATARMPIFEPNRLFACLHSPSCRLGMCVQIYTKYLVKLRSVPKRQNLLEYRSRYGALSWLSLVVGRISQRRS